MKCSPKTHILCYIDFSVAQHSFQFTLLKLAWWLYNYLAPHDSFHARVSPSSGMIHYSLRHHPNLECQSSLPQLLFQYIDKALCILWAINSTQAPHASRYRIQQQVWPFPSPSGWNLKEIQQNFHDLEPSHPISWLTVPWRPLLSSQDFSQFF